MEEFQKFLSFEYADEVMIAVGAFLVFIGVTRIIRSSLTMVFWVALSGLGVASVSYGMNHSSIDLPFLDDPKASLAELIEMVGPGKALSADALAILCERLNIGDQGS